MSEKLMIGGVDLFKALKDMGFEDEDDGTNNDFIPPFQVREVVEWSHVQKLSRDELKAHLLEKHIIEKESIIFSTLINKDKEFIIVYGYDYDPFYIVATIISSDNSYNHISIAAMERQDGSLFILDISVRNKDANNGYGTILMEQLKANAKQHNKRQITGDLTPDDLSDHGDRLIHFYKKHGFEVEEFGHYAKIRWVNSSLNENGGIVSAK
ncbi:GNAT family N-acetyltransferase [Brevibacillus brevis]|uniref:GNAT family N-acetyltransferase n=1 Tax=Brevibacillus brevis TaxID=1393 RepID=UPI0007D8A689|nr:GNAT family N-acetyltransferase [Brevibacillus brevis]